MHTLSICSRCEWPPDEPTTNPGMNSAVATAFPHIFQATHWVLSARPRSLAAGGDDLAMPTLPLVARCAPTGPAEVLPVQPNCMGKPAETMPGFVVSLCVAVCVWDFTILVGRTNETKKF